MEAVPSARGVLTAVDRTAERPSTDHDPEPPTVDPNKVP